MRKRITFVFEEVTDDGDVQSTVVTLQDGFTESLPHVLNAFVAFLRSMTFRVNSVGAVCGRYLHTSDDI